MNEAVNEMVQFYGDIKGGALIVTASGRGGSDLEGLLPGLRDAADSSGVCTSVPGVLAEMGIDSPTLRAAIMRGVDESIERHGAVFLESLPVEASMYLHELYHLRGEQDRDSLPRMSMVVANAPNVYAEYWSTDDIHFIADAADKALLPHEGMEPFDGVRFVVPTGDNTYAEIGVLREVGESPEWSNTVRFQESSPMQFVGNAIADEAARIRASRSHGEEMRNAPIEKVREILREDRRELKKAGLLR